MAEKLTAPKIRSMKGGRIVCVTAYDAPTARIADESGVDLILVGDSLGNVVLGYENTIPVSLDDMVHHVHAVARGVKKAFLVADMPFGTYQASTDDAVRTAVALVKAGAEAVKLEGAYTEAIKEIIRAGIPVMGHVGMTPQSYHSYGGYKVQGKGKQGEEVLRSAKEVSNAGVFSVVLEMIPAGVSEKITKELSIPTIGIGAGIHCDGEIQVFHDLLGISPDPPLKHTKRYMQGWDLMAQALKKYAQDVRDKKFPTDKNSF